MEENGLFHNDADRLGTLFGSFLKDPNNIKIVLEMLPSAVALVDAEGRFQYVNKRGCELYGVDYTGFDIDRYVSAVKAQRLDGSPLPLEEMPVSQSLKSGLAVHNVEMTIQNMNGKQYQVSVCSSPLYDANGKINGAIVISKDFSERKKNDKALIDINEELAQQAEDKYRMLFNSIDQGFFLIDIIFDENDKPVDMLYVEANAAATKILGSDYAGKRLREVNPDYEEYWFEIFGKVALTGQSVRMEQYAEPDKKWYSFFIFKIGGEKSRRIGNIFLDITERKKTEATLKESERLFRTIFDNTEDGFVLTQPIFDESGQSDDYLMLEVNKAWEKQTGLRAADLVGKTIKQSLLEVEPVWPATFADVIKSGKSVHFESYNRNTSRWYDLYAFNYQQGKVGVLFRDITERKRAEEALRDSEERMRVLVNSMPDEVWFTDKDKMVTLVNPAVLREFGEASHGDRVEKIASSFEVYGPDGNSRPVEEAPPLRALSGEVVRNQEEIVRIPARDELRYRQVNASPVIDAGGNIIGSVSIVRDITEQKRVELMLRESETRLTEFSRNLAAEVDALRFFHQINTRFIRQEDIQLVYRDLLDAAISLTNADCGTMQLADEKEETLGIVMHRNLSAAFMGHFERVTHIGACGRAFSEKCRVIVEDVSQSSVFAGTPERQVLLDDGIFCVQSTPMFSGAGHILGILTTHYKSPHVFNERELRVLDLLARQAADVVEQVRMEEALREKEVQAQLLSEALEKRNRLVTDFFINISHEFKTPLTILMLGLDLLEKKTKKLLGGKEISGNLTAMKQNSYRLNKLVANLLDITKLDAGFMQPKWEMIDLASLLKNLTHSVEPYTRQKQLKFEYVCNAAEIPFTTDSFMIERIVLNLLSNAIKHTPVGGQILIDCQANENGVSIVVKDTGEGIPDDKKTIIFDRFSQVDTKMTRTSEGTGIGLALIKSLVELLDGRVSFESTLGAGSTFTVELPAIQKASSNGMIEKSGMQMDKRVQMELSDILGM